MLGRHPGIAHFTVGQRKGLGLSLGGASAEALHVVRIEAARRRVVVGPRAKLGATRVRLRGVNWIGDGAEPRSLVPADVPVEVQVKLRSTSPPVPAVLKSGPGGEWPGGEWIVTLARPEFAVAPGQACVVYRASRVLGGGWIAGTEQTAA